MIKRRLKIIYVIFNVLVMFVKKKERMRLKYDYFLFEEFIYWEIIFMLIYEYLKGYLKRWVYYDKIIMLD